MKPSISTVWEVNQKIHGLVFILFQISSLEKDHASSKDEPLQYNTVINDIHVHRSWKVTNRYKNPGFLVSSTFNTAIIDNSYVHEANCTEESLIRSSNFASKVEF